MKVAIARFGSRVSPHFSTAPSAIVLLMDKGRIVSMMHLTLGNETLHHRKQKLLSLGIDTLVCGGIDELTRKWFENRGVRIVANTWGEIHHVLSGVLRIPRNIAALIRCAEGFSESS